MDSVSILNAVCLSRGFKAMGRGYQKRINRILQYWLQMKIMDVISNEGIWEDEEVKRLFAMRKK